MDLGTSTLGELALGQTVNSFQATADMSIDFGFLTELNAIGIGVGSFTTQLDISNSMTAYSKRYTELSFNAISFDGQPAQPEIHRTLFINTSNFDVSPSNTGIYYHRVLALDTANFTITPITMQVLANRYLNLDSASFTINFEDIDLLAYKRASLLHKRLVIFNEEISEARFLEIFNELTSEE